MRTLIITGGNGYIGLRLREVARSQGRQVILLGRTTASQSTVPWQLGEPFPLSREEAGGAALVHLAHDWSNRANLTGEPGGLNKIGSQLLQETGRQAGVARFVFVSSQSARADAPNIYGRLKWQTEEALKGDGVISARVGLVYGGPRKAMYGLLCKLVTKLPILPMISANRMVQPIHIDEVCRGLIAFADNDVSGWRGLAQPAPISFAEFLRTLARETQGLKIRILPIPLWFALLAASLTRFIPLVPTVDKERILGLAGTQPMPCAEHLRQLELEVLPLERGLRAESIGRRGRLKEGHTLLTYVSGRHPPISLLKAYLKGIRLREGDAGPVGVGHVFIAFPSLIRFIEPLSIQSALARRLRLATKLADAAAEVAGPISKGRRLRFLVLGVMVDCLALPFRLFVTLVQR